MRFPSLRYCAEAVASIVLGATLGIAANRYAPGVTAPIHRARAAIAAKIDPSSAPRRTDVATTNSPSAVHRNVAASRPNVIPHLALPAETRPYPLHEFSFHRPGFRAIRGTTIGPIENQLHPDRGYGSAACAKTMHEVRRMGGNWVSLTPFGRVYGLTPTGISHRFEVPFAENRKAVAAAVAQAHAEGLRVLLVPHLWVETGEWRGKISPKTEAGWRQWSKAYAEFVTSWAQIAEESQVDLLAVGVELRSWVTTGRAAEFLPVIERVRQVYTGPLTYAANWDDVHDTTIWGHLDVIGINAFYPLARRENATDAELLERAARVASETHKLAARWGKPVVFTEFGYTTRKDPALKPWEWPEHLKSVSIDEADQARAYRAILRAFIPHPWFMGMFVWRLYADPSDVSQEPEWGFSPRGKLAELELVDAFNAHWGADGPRPIGTSLERFATYRVRAF